MPSARMPAPRRQTGAHRLLTRLLLAALIAALYPFPASAEIARKGLSVSGVEELLHHTATDAELMALSVQRSASPLLASVLAAIPSDLTVAFRQTLARDLAGPRLAQRFHELFAARSNRSHVQKLLAFYRSPLGRRYAHADRRPRPGVARPDSKLVSQARSKLLDHWLEASWTMRRFEAEVVVSAAGLGRSLTVLGQKHGPTAEELAAPMRSPELRAAVVEHYASTLRDFDDADLTAILRLERSPAGRWYRRVELDALTQTLEEGFRALEIEAQALRLRMTQRYGKPKS